MCTATENILILQLIFIMFTIFLLDLLRLFIILILTKWEESALYGDALEIMTLTLDLSLNKCTKSLTTHVNNAFIAWTSDSKCCILSSQERTGNIHNFSVYFSIDANNVVTSDGYIHMRRTKPDRFIGDSTITCWTGLEAVIHYYQRTAQQNTGRPSLSIFLFYALAVGYRIKTSFYLYWYFDFTQKFI